MVKILIVVLIAVTVIGGFVGPELRYNNFSMTGAVIGGVGIFSVLMALGVFFRKGYKGGKFVARVAAKKARSF